MVFVIDSCKWVHEATFCFINPTLGNVEEVLGVHRSALCSHAPWAELEDSLTPSGQIGIVFSWSAQWHTMLASQGAGLVMLLLFMWSVTGSPHQFERRHLPNEFYKLFSVWLMIKRKIFVVWYSSCLAVHALWENYTQRDHEFMRILSFLGSCESIILCNSLGHYFRKNMMLQFPDWCLTNQNLGMVGFLKSVWLQAIK